MNILIGGDVAPTKTNEDLFKDGNTIELLGSELHSIWKNSDIRIFNLETPLLDNEDPINKHGPNLIASTSTIKGIVALKPSLITLANNHILDQGITGLESTVNLLSRYTIPFVGIGNNLDNVLHSYILKINGMKVGVYACTEHEFTIAEKENPGANPFDPLESLDHISRLKSKTDFVIVLYHGGKEHYRYPSPYLQKVCRKIAEKGANLIVCQHSHCVGCFEKYNDATIIYGQGNFIFDRSNSEFWKTSLLINIEFENSGYYIDYIPILKDGNKVRLAKGNQAEKILNEFKKRSSEIKQENFLEKKYVEFAEENLFTYLRNFSGLGKWVSRIDRLVFNHFFLKRIYGKQKMLAIQNYIECEAHRELFLAGLKGRTNSEGK